MCATIVWAVSQAVFGEAFVAETTARLGVAPQLTEYRVASSRVRADAVHFTVTRRMCDCDSLVGLRQRDLEDGETTAPALLGWVRDMPSFAPQVSRLALLRAWNPGALELTPRKASGVQVARVDEQLLRRVADDALLTIDYPRTAPTGSTGPTGAAGSGAQGRK